MHRHCGTNNRAPRWTFTDPCQLVNALTEVCQCQSVNASTCRFVNVSICQCQRVNMSMSTCQYIDRKVSMSICQHVDLSICSDVLFIIYNLAYESAYEFMYVILCKNYFVRIFQLSSELSMAFGSPTVGTTNCNFVGLYTIPFGFSFFF